MTDLLLKTFSAWFLRRHFHMHILVRHKYYIYTFTGIFINDGGHHIWRVLCPYGITKGDLKLQNSKAPSRTIAMKKVGKQTQLAHHVTRLYFKRPTRRFDKCSRHLMFIEEIMTSRSKLLNTLGRGYARGIR
jgi:hypothetical protein